MADVIIFYGLPFTGKTAHYEENYASYQRVSAEEMYQSDPTISLRQIILQVVGYLRNGCKVVIDDENWSAVTRASYINSIGSKIPGCSFDCVTFEPREKIQVYWAREWALAELCITGLPDNHIGIDMCQSDNKFKRWFNDASSMPNRQTLTPPRESEGFTIIKVKTYLQTRVFYKFEVPALFIELEGIAKHGSEKISQVRDTMNKWYKFNPCGRIIIINDGQKDEDSQEESQMKKILLEICEDFNTCPVYFCGIEDNSRCGQFAVPPNPGLIAWLQRLHHIQLNHRGTLYLVSSIAHTRCAQSAGLSYMTASTVFNHPTIVTAPHCATKSHEPSILQSMKLKLPSETQQSKAQVPLFAEAKDGNFYQTLCKGGRFHGMCFQSVQVLEKYQQMYEDHATPLRQKNSKIDLLRQQYLQEHTDSTVKDAPNVTSRSLPKWLLPRNQREPKPSDSKGVATPTKDAGKRDSSSVYGYGSKQSPKKKLCRSLSRSSTVYCMNELELVDTAKMVLKELGCRHSDLMDVIKKKESHSSEGNIKNEPEIDRSSVHSHTASETSDQHQHSKDVFSLSRNDSNESERKDIASDGSPSQQTGRHTVRQTGKHQDSCEVNLFPANKTFPDSESDPLRISQQDTTNTPAKKKINQGPDLTFLDDIF